MRINIRFRLIRIAIIIFDSSTPYLNLLNQFEHYIQKVELSNVIVMHAEGRMLQLRSMNSRTRNVLGQLIAIAKVLNVLSLSTLILNETYFCDGCATVAFCRLFIEICCDVILNRCNISAARDCSVISLSWELNQIERPYIVGNVTFWFLRCRLELLLLTRLPLLLVFLLLFLLRLLFVLTLLVVFLLLLSLLPELIVLDFNALPLELTEMKILRSEAIVTRARHEGQVPSCWIHGETHSEWNTWPHSVATITFFSLNSIQMLQSNAISPFGVDAEVVADVDTDVFAMGCFTLEVLFLGYCVKVDDDDWKIPNIHRNNTKLNNFIWSLPTKTETIIKHRLVCRFSIKDNRTARAMSASSNWSIVGTLDCLDVVTVDELG